MSLNFIETLLDKLSPKDSGNNILKNYTGSQSFVGSNVSFNDSILHKYQEALLEGNDFSSTNLSIKRSLLESSMFPFHYSASTNSLVSRVSKLFFPTASFFQDYSRIYQELNTSHKILNKVNLIDDNVWEQFLQAFNLAVKISKHSSFLQNHTVSSNSIKQSADTSIFSDTTAICTSSSVNKLPSLVVECLVESSPQQIENLIEPQVAVEVLASTSQEKKDKKLSEPDMAVITVCESYTVQKSKITPDNGTLNHELANRKTKEMQKRSRNRKRRLKRNKNNVQKNSSNVSNDQKLKSQSLCVVDSVVSQIGCSLTSNKQQNASKNSTTCNAIDITYNANSVQIIFPSVSSFLITVDSADDDSDWDEDDDSGWLNDTSGFDFCALNVANLPSSKLSTSFLSVPQCHDEDVEALQLNMLLHRVNKEWNEATKDLDGKAKSFTKVSFVPDHELVEVLPVEIYERKGEWEMYALERLRFKRRIDELDKIISPCLTREHRKNFLQKYLTDL